MARKHKPEDIIGKRRQAEIVLVQGNTVAETFEPCAPQALCRSYPGQDAGVRAAGVSRAGATSIDTAQDAARGRSTLNTTGFLSEASEREYFYRVMWRREKDLNHQYGLS